MSATQTKTERRKSDEAFRRDVLTILAAQKRVLGALAQQVTLLQQEIEELKAARIIH